MGEPVAFRVFTNIIIHESVHKRVLVIMISTKHRTLQQWETLQDLIPPISRINFSFSHTAKQDLVWSCLATLSLPRQGIVERLAIFISP